MGVASTPLAQADVKHLRDQQSQAQHSVRHAQADLDEASKQTARAAAALSRSRAELHAARHDLQVARDQVHAARVRLHQIQRQLQRAQTRLATAETNLARGQQAAADQRSTLVHTVTSFYEQGDPQLVGMMSLLQSVSPADLTARDANNSFVLSSQDQALDGLEATAVLLEVQTEQLADARDLVARKRAQADAKLAAGEALQGAGRRRPGPRRRRACGTSSTPGRWPAAPAPTTSASWPAPRPAPPASTASSWPRSPASSAAGAATRARPAAC